MHFTSSERQHLGRIMRDLDKAAQEPLPEKISALVHELERVLERSDMCPSCGSERTLICPICDPYELPPKP